MSTSLSANNRLTSEFSGEKERDKKMPTAIDVWRGCNMDVAWFTVGTTYASQDVLNESEHSKRDPRAVGSSDHRSVSARCKHNMTSEVAY